MESQMQKYFWEIQKRSKRITKKGRKEYFLWKSRKRPRKKKKERKRKVCLESSPVVGESMSGIKSEVLTILRMTMVYLHEQGQECARTRP